MKLNTNMDVNINGEMKGKLSLNEQYVNGNIHGTARQYGRQGTIIGTDSLRHGTNFRPFAKYQTREL